MHRSEREEREDPAGTEEWLAIPGAKPAGEAADESEDAAGAAEWLLHGAEPIGAVEPPGSGDEHPSEATAEWLLDPDSVRLEEPERARDESPQGEGAIAAAPAPGETALATASEPETPTLPQDAEAIESRIQAAVAQAQAEARRRLQEEAARLQSDVERRIREEAAARAREGQEWTRAAEAKLRADIERLRGEAHDARQELERLRTEGTDLREALDLARSEMTSSTAIPAPPREEAQPIPPAGEPARSSRSIGEGPVDLNTATFAELRELGMSVTQAKRTIRYRDQAGGFDSIEQLDSVPGFPDALRREMRSRLRV
jgi:Helix-hairpin-helix motif